MFQYTALRSTVTHFTSSDHAPVESDTTSRLYAEDPFRARFGSRHRLPRGLREEARGMGWSLFTATYAPTADLRITRLDSTRLRGGRHHYSADLTRTPKTAQAQTESCEITATGPTSACSHLLADAGRPVEILAFHQFDLYEATVTFLHVGHQHDHNRHSWAMGFGANPETSVAAALSSGAQIIYG